MSQDIQTFIDAAKQKGLNDEAIRQKLLAAGWDSDLVDSALDGLVVPLPPSRQEPATPSQPSQPVTIVNNQSTRGFEYHILFIALLMTSLGFAGLLHDAVDLVTNTTIYGHIGGLFAATSLLVMGPIFTILFFRLKRAEDKEPDLRKDPFRRKWIQTTLFVTFLIGIGHIIYFVYSLMSPDRSYNGYSASVTEPAGNTTIALLLHVIATVFVAGGIFAYYWIDEHKQLPHEL